jgi:hypothetical protein
MGAGAFGGARRALKHQKTPVFRPGQEISNDYFEASIKKIAECVEHRDRDQSYAGDEEAGNSAMPEDNDGDKKND